MVEHLPDGSRVQADVFVICIGFTSNTVLGEQLRIACLCTASRDLNALRGATLRTKTGTVSD